MNSTLPTGASSAVKTMLWGVLYTILIRGAMHLLFTKIEVETEMRDRRYRGRNQYTNEYSICCSTRFAQRISKDWFGARCKREGKDFSSVDISAAYLVPVRWRWMYTTCDRTNQLEQRWWAELWVYTGKITNEKPGEDLRVNSHWFDNKHRQLHSLTISRREQPRW